MIIAHVWFELAVSAQLSVAADHLHPIRGAHAEEDLVQLIPRSSQLMIKQRGVYTVA